MGLFKVGEAVFAKVKHFAPFPALIESVLMNESDCSVFYYVRLFGAANIVPLDAKHLQPIKENKGKYRLKYSETEMQRESKMRVDALLGAEDEIPEVLMNFVTVDSDFEEVSDETVKRLGLYSIMLTPSMVEKLDVMTISENENQDSEDEEEFVDVEGVKPDCETSNILRAQAGDQNQYHCPTCPKSYRNKKSLRTHMRNSLVCSNTRLKQAVGAERRKKLFQHHRSILKKNSQCTSDSTQSKKVEESVMEDRSKWASRSASGYYPCKLCFRKFRSKGEVQSHMATHQPQRSLRRDVRKSSPPDASSIDASDYDTSLSGDEAHVGKSSAKHCSMERERRAQMAAQFQELANTVGLARGISKLRTLEVAKSKIRELETEADEQEKLMARLEDEYVKLKARYLKLNPDKEF